MPSQTPSRIRFAASTLAASALRSSRRTRRIYRDHARHHARGFVAVPVNYKFPRALIAEVIADSGARLVFSDPNVFLMPELLPRVVIQTTDDAQGFDAFIARQRS